MRLAAERSSLVRLPTQSSRRLVGRGFLRGSSSGLVAKLNGQRMRSARFPDAGWVLLKNLSPVDVERLRERLAWYLTCECR